MHLIIPIYLLIESKMICIFLQRGQEQVLGDLSMILCDPYAVNFLASSAIKIALHLINGEALPRENAVLVLLLRMLALGLSAWQMIDSQDFKEPKLDSQVVTKFLPALMSLMVNLHRLYIVIRNFK